MTTKINITESESKVLKAINDSDYATFYGESVWTWSVVYCCSIKGKSFSGVVSSLVEKGLIETHDAPRKDESCMRLTELGMSVCEENGCAGKFQPKNDPDNNAGEIEELKRINNELR